MGMRDKQKYAEMGHIQEIQYVKEYIYTSQQRSRENQCEEVTVLDDFLWINTRFPGRSSFECKEKVPVFW